MSTDLLSNSCLSDGVDDSSNLSSCADSNFSVNSEPTWMYLCKNIMAYNCIPNCTARYTIDTPVLSFLITKWYGHTEKNNNFLAIRATINLSEPYKSFTLYIKNGYYSFSNQCIIIGDGSLNSTTDIKNMKKRLDEILSYNLKNIDYNKQTYIIPLD